MPDRIRPRNPVARSPLLRKGGVHARSHSAVRQGRRRVLEQDLTEWVQELEFERALTQSELSEDLAE